MAAMFEAIKLIPTSTNISIGGERISVIDTGNLSPHQHNLQDQTRIRQGYSEDSSLDSWKLKFYTDLNDMRIKFGLPPSPAMEEARLAEAFSSSVVRPIPVHPTRLGAHSKGKICEKSDFQASEVIHKSLDTLALEIEIASDVELEELDETVAVSIDKTEFNLVTSEMNPIESCEFGGARKVLDKMSKANIVFLGSCFHLVKSNAPWLLTEVTNSGAQNMFDELPIRGFNVKISLIQLGCAQLSRGLSNWIFDPVILVFDPGIRDYVDGLADCLSGLDFLSLWNGLMLAILILMFTSGIALAARVLVDYQVLAECCYGYCCVLLVTW